MLRFLRKLKRLFRKPDKPDIDEIVHEHWKTSFSVLKKKRFDKREDEKFYFNRQHAELILKLKQRNVFAWAENPWYRYDNFIYSVVMRFDSDSGYYSGGLVFRFLDNENFYYFILSNKGYFRFDRLLNGIPEVLIPWTETEVFNERENNITVIADSDSFVFLINDEWAAELEDDGLNAGRIGLGAQNYDESEQAQVNFTSIELESRPLDVEKIHYRWKEYIEIDPVVRSKLARSFYTINRPELAVVQLKKASKVYPLQGEDYSLLADCFFRLSMFSEALDAADKAIEHAPDSNDGYVYKAHAYYLLNKFLETRNFIAEHIECFSDNAVIWNLYGNSEYSLGNWQSAADKYAQAAELGSEMPLYLVNRAKALEAAGDKDKAIEQYLEVSRQLFHQEAYSELYPIFERVQEIDPDNIQVRSLEAKILFHEERFPEAEDLFEELAETECRDSSVYFLLGCIKSLRGQYKDAIPLYEHSVDIESNVEQYWIKYTEALYFAGYEVDQALKEGISRFPDSIWLLNLRGKRNMERENLDEAQEDIQKALEKAPSEVDIRINYAELLYRMGQSQKALEILNSPAGNNSSEDTGSSEDPRIRNERGNIFVRENNLQQALSEYEAALKQDTENYVYMENCAAVCLELDMISRAEELLTKLYDGSPNGRVYNMLAQVATIRGQYVRAESALREGISLYPDNQDLLVNLANVYMIRRRFDKAKPFLEQTLELGPNTQAESMLKKVKAELEITIFCAECKRKWIAPKNLTEQPPLRLRGAPPDYAPAGKCPSCGNIYCIGCGQKHMKNQRFVCPECGEYLKLSDNTLRYVLSEIINEEKV